MGVDYTTTLSGAQNGSAVRIEGTDTFTHGLFITDLVHMPGGICGTWPAWWLLGDTSTNPAPTDPTGEIDIIENANDADINTSTLWAYKTGTCATNDYRSSMIGTLQKEKQNPSAKTKSCEGNEAGVGGCEIDGSSTDSFGAVSTRKVEESMRWNGRRASSKFSSFRELVCRVEIMGHWEVARIRRLGESRRHDLEEVVVWIVIFDSCQ
jgi:hypothetical protein